MHGRGHTKFATSAKKLLELSTPSYCSMATTFDLPLDLFVNEEATMHQNYSRGNRKRLPSKLLAYQSVAQYHVFLVMVFQYTLCFRF